MSAESRTSTLVIGIDIGTSSTKGVLVDATSGAVLASAQRAHTVSRPLPGHVEMNPMTWEQEFMEIVVELEATSRCSLSQIEAVAVSGMGPCVVLADDDGTPVRDAILYGIDTRATEQIEVITTELSEDAIVASGGSRLSSQSVGPKIRWVYEREPEVAARATALFMPASFLIYRLTGSYVLDHSSASQCSPLYVIENSTWHSDWWMRLAPTITPPRLGWSGEVAGVITAEAAARTGLPVGVPVTFGAIDAWAEAVSVGSVGDGDLMLMYGTTMFLVATGPDIVRSPSMWTTVGVASGSWNLAGGLATSGAITDWLTELCGTDHETLLSEAAASPPGAAGLLLLPYFAGERTPILDPKARGAILGLTLEHTRGDIYRAVLEATAFAVRHNIETMRAAGVDVRRAVAVGGGARGELWPQIVSDVTGMPQQIPAVTVGACLGDAVLAASALSSDADESSIARWNPITHHVTPDPVATAMYDQLFAHYLELYEATRHITHELADSQIRSAGARNCTGGQS